MPRYLTGKPGVAASLILLLLTLGGCQTSPSDNPDLRTLHVSVYYREKIKLPDGARLKVSLEDVARADAPAVVIAEKETALEGGPPYPVQLDYNVQAIDERGRYALRARIEHEGKLLFINTSHIPAFKAGDYTEILVESVQQRP